MLALGWVPKVTFLTSGTPSFQVKSASRSLPFPEGEHPRLGGEGDLIPPPLEPLLRDLPFGDELLDDACILATS